MKRLEKNASIHDEELLSAQFTINDMNSDFEKYKRQIKNLKYMVDKQKTSAERRDTEIDDLNSRLQDAYDELRDLKTSFKIEKKAKIEIELQFESLLEEKEQESENLLNSLKQQFEAKELRMSQSI